jgi:hypothetical protein
MVDSPPTEICSIDEHDAVFHNQICIEYYGLLSDYYLKYEIRHLDSSMVMFGL